MSRMTGTVDVDLGGSNRVLKFDFNALCEMEEHFGKPATEIFAAESIGLKVLRDSLYFGLRRFQPQVDIAQVGNWLEEEARKGNFQYVAQQLSSALQHAISGLDGPEGNSTAPEKGAAEYMDKDSTTLDS